MLTHDELKHKILSDTVVKAMYDELEDEYALIEECLKARNQLLQLAGLGYCWNYGRQKK